MSASLAPVLQEAAALHARGALAEAERRYKSVLKADARNFNALHLLGVIRIQQGRLDEATRLIAASLKSNPRSAAAHSNLASALTRSGRHADAAAAAHKAIALDPDFADAHTNLGLALHGLARYGEALAHQRRAVELAPDSAIAHNNLGLALQATGDAEGALAAYRKALALRPHFADALANAGALLHTAGRIDDALAHYDMALAAVPDHAGAHWNAGLAHLLRGDLARGWPEYEWRLQRAPASDPKLPGRRWSGQVDVRDKRIFLYEEQGYGDSMQFVRYAPLLARAGARVLIEADAPLQRLFESVAGVQSIVSKGARRPAADLHSPLMSLPYAFGTTLESIPADVPYVQAPAERMPRWDERLGPRKRLRAALAWSGRRTHRNDVNRSIALQALAPLLGVANVDFVTLQPEVREPDAEVLQRFPNLRHIGRELGDFADTACVASLVDLVISVDTAPAHLAGALGRPLWLLLPFTPDWRWLLGRDDSPWYPTARLMRQTRPGDWDDVVARVVGELRSRAGA